MYTTGYMEYLINIEPPVFTEIVDTHLYICPISVTRVNSD